VIRPTCTPNQFSRKVALCLPNRFVSQAFLFPRQRRRGRAVPAVIFLLASSPVLRPVSQHPFPLKPVQSLVSGHRYSALAVWSPLARQNGALTGRRQHASLSHATALRVQHPNLTPPRIIDNPPVNRSVLSTSSRRRRSLRTRSARYRAASWTRCLPILANCPAS
jgi:hypothetical protein